MMNHLLLSRRLCIWLTFFLSWVSWEGYYLVGHPILKSCLYMIADLAEVEEEGNGQKIFNIKKISTPTIKYEGIEWNVKSLREGMIFLAKNLGRNKTAISLGNTRKIAIAKNLLRSALIDIKGNGYAYYFELGYQDKGMAKQLNLLALSEETEFDNSYFMIFEGKKGKGKECPWVGHQLPFRSIENKELNLMRLLFQLEHNKSLVVEERSGLVDQKSSILQTPISFYFKTYTNRMGRERTNDRTKSPLYVACFQDDASIVCHEYEHGLSSKVWVKSPNVEASIKPLLTPGDYTLFVTKGVYKKSFYDPATFQKLHKKHWINRFLAHDQIKEIIQGHNLAFELKQEDESAMELEDEQTAATLSTRLGKISKKSIKLNTGNLGSFKYEHTMCHFVRGKKEHIGFHHFTFSSDDDTIQVIAVPNLFLKGKGKLVFEQKAATTGEWQACSKEENEEYTLMLLDAFAMGQHCPKKEQISSAYQGRRGDRSSVKVIISEDTTKMYKEVWRNFSKQQDPIRLKGSDSERAEPTTIKGGNNGLYIKGGVGIIATLMIIKYGIARQKGYTEDE